MLGNTGQGERPMDSAWWYGNTMSLKGQHSRQIADWADYAADLEDTAEAWKAEAEELERELKKAGSSRDTYKIISEVVTKSYNKLKADHAAYVANVNEKWGLLADQWRVERAQKVFFQTMFNLLLEYVPGLREDMLKGGKGIPNEAHEVYGQTLRAFGITLERLEKLKSSGYEFIGTPPSFGAPAATSSPSETPGTEKPVRTFVPNGFIEKKRFEDMRTKYNDVVDRHNALLDDRLQWAYRSVLNKAEAEGHKAVLDLIRSSPRETDLDAIDPSIPAPEDHCDSPTTAAFRRAYASHLLEEKADKEELERFARETSFEFPFPVQAYMDWIAGQSHEDALSEDQEGPRVP